MAFVAETAAMAIDRETSTRRRSPRPFDTDWLVLRGLAQAVRDLLPRASGPDSRAIDFGCGSRPYAALVEEAGWAYVGADFTGAELAIDAAGRIGIESASCDLVLSFQVLEHVPDLATYLGEARRILRPGGSLLLSTHGSWFYHPHPQDHRRWTREGLIAELQAHGFVARDCLPVVGPLAWSTILRLTCGSYALRKIPVVGAGLAAALALVMNLRAIVEDRVTPAWVTRDNACVYLVLAACREDAA